MNEPRVRFLSFSDVYRQRILAPASDRPHQLLSRPAEQPQTAGPTIRVGSAVIPLDALEKDRA